MGTRKTTHTDTRTDEDHPHACGDKTQKMIEKKYCEGSSPRVWGQGKTKFLRGDGWGIIPTRVGTSEYIFQTATQGKDHPHACGDKSPFLCRGLQS